RLPRHGRVALRVRHRGGHFHDDLLRFGVQRTLPPGVQLEASFVDQVVDAGHHVAPVRDVGDGPRFADDRVAVVELRQVNVRDGQPRGVVQDDAVQVFADAFVVARVVDDVEFHGDADAAPVLLQNLGEGQVAGGFAHVDFKFEAVGI